MEYLLFLVCGLASLLGSLAGFGGGIFVVPLMVMGFNIPIEVAIGITAICLFPSSLISTLANWRSNNIDFRMAVLLEVPTMIGAFAGAVLTSYLPTKPLEIIFAFFLIFLSWRMFHPVKADAPLTALGRFVLWINHFKPHLQHRPYQVGYWAAGIFGTLAGVLAGLLGIGGGILKTPLILKVFKAPMRTATATSLCMIVFTSLISGSTHFSLGHFDIDVFIPAVSGFIAGALYGAWIGVKLKDQMIGKIISFSILLAGFATLAHALLS